MRLARSLRVGFKRLSYGGIGGGSDGARVVAWIGPEPGMRIADIGSGIGDFAMRFGDAVGGSGIVYAVDVDEDLREAVAEAARRRGLPQVVPTPASADDPGIPEPVDLVFLSSSFHHLPDQGRYFEHVKASLRPGGAVVILEGRRGTFTGWLGHATRPEDVRSTLQGAGFRLVGSADFVPQKSLQRFALAGEPRGGRTEPAPVKP
jgi:ubiquinone/menaquinone biosynthesis C-methylase UbiE